MSSYLEDDNNAIFDTGSHYRGPVGGSASFVDGSVSVFDGQGGVKLAGADSEEGRKRKAEVEEPRSILIATKEYWDKMLSGTGEALSKGKEGAKDALSQTWGELTGNEDLHKGASVRREGGWRGEQGRVEGSGKGCGYGDGQILSCRYRQRT